MYGPTVLSVETRRGFLVVVSVVVYHSSSRIP